MSAFRRFTTLAVTALLALYWLLAVSTSPRVGVTADEVVHLTAGYSYWKTNDYRMQPENGTLAMRVAALPLLALDLRWITTDHPEWRTSIVNRVGYDFCFRLGNPLDRMLLAARGAIALLGAFTLWLTWRWAHGLFGARAGWLALGLAAFCPALLAHGALATSDMAITATLLAAVTCFWRLLHVVTWPRLILTSVAGGAVLLAKMSGVLVAPMLAALLVVRWIRPAPLVVRLGATPRWLRRRGAVAVATLGATLATGLASLVLLWAGYGFRFAMFAGPQPAGTQPYFTWTQILEEMPMPNPWPDGAPSRLSSPLPAPSPTAATRLLGWVRDHRLLPEAYLWGMAHTYKFSRSRPAFLNGEFRLTGWPQFFPWTFWLKTTLPALALLAAGLTAVCAGAGRRRAAHWRWLHRAAPLLALFAIYWAAALGSHLNIGHRHILPTYPVVYVFAGAAALWLALPAARLVALALGVAVAAHAADSTLARPHYLAYFQLFGGGTRHGWRHLVDSSFDWGQGLPDLARWLDARAAAGDQAPVYLTYFGDDAPQERHLRVSRFADETHDLGPRTFPVRPTGGWFAISATHFQRLYLWVTGPWNARYEEHYQESIRALALARAGTEAAPDRARLLRAAMDYEVLEFGRLCAFLQDREPDDVIGGSILLFRLTDAEVSLALHGPVPPSPAR